MQVALPWGVGVFAVCSSYTVVLCGLFHLMMYISQIWESSVHLVRLDCNLPRGRGCDRSKLRDGVMD